MRVALARLSLLVLAGWIVLSAPPRPAVAATAQGTTNPPATQFPSQLLETLRQLQKAALESDYAYKQLAHLTDNIGPRLAGSPQAQQAVEYVAGELRRLGLDVHLEKVMVPHWVRGVETGELVEYPGGAAGTTQKIVLTALGGSPATPGDGITADVVVADSFDEFKALKREQVAGKIVLFNEPFDHEMAAAGYAFQSYVLAVRYRALGPKVVAAQGAVACLVRSVGSAEYRLPHTGAAPAAAIPAAAVTAEDSGLIARLARQGRVRMHLTLTPQTLPDVESFNVIGDLKGSEHPEQIVLVSGHLDSWDLGTGAIDDGAGVAIAMGTANLVEQLHLRPRRTIRVVAWMDEESRGSGRQAYMRDYRAEIGNHVGAIESDFGADHPLGFNASVKPEALPLLQPIMDVLETTGATMLRGVEGGGTGADIRGLADAGVPSFGLLQDGRTYFNYHHTAADTLDKVTPRSLAENSAVMAVLAYALADMPSPLPRK